MRHQFSRLISYLDNLPVTFISMDGIEADDTIAYIAQMYETECKKITIVSTDRDFYQLVDERIQVWSPIKKKMYDVDAVKEELGYFFESHDLVMDGGPCIGGVESTIIDCTGAEAMILRPGLITLEKIEEVLMKQVRVDITGNVRVSGMKLSHYAPRANVTLDTIPVVGQGMIALKIVPTPPGVARLASPENEEEFAGILYEALRFGDRLNLQSITVIQPQEQGVGLAIRDRLTKMAFNSGP
jgi:hypothetical protein